MNNIITFYDKIKDVYIIPDIHGDYNQLIYLLYEKYKLINEKLKWIGKNAFLVVLGDILDGGGRGSDGVTTKKSESALLNLLVSLKKQSRKYNGEVILIYGNHEYANLFAHKVENRLGVNKREFYEHVVFPYVSRHNLEDFGGLESRMQKFKPGGEYCNLLANNFQYVAVVNGILYSHMGIDMEFVKFIKSKILSSKMNLLESINYIIQCYLLKKDDISDDIFSGLFITDLLQNVTKTSFEELNKYLNTELKIDICFQVVGHYVGNYVRDYPGIIFCDIGMSDAFKLRGTKVKHMQLLYTTIYSDCPKSKSEVVEVYKKNKHVIDDVIIEPLFLVNRRKYCMGIIQLSILKK